MATLFIQPAKKKDKEEVEQLVRQATALIRKNDKELTEQEIDYERKARALDIVSYPRIHPMKATVGFMVRSMKGGNQQAIAYLNAALAPNAASGGSQSNLVELIIEFNNLDEASQNRVDCLDHLCIKHRIKILTFLDKMKDGILVFNNIMTTTIIAENKPELAEAILTFARDKKQPGDRRLAAEMSGLTSNQPLVEVNQTKKIVNNTTQNNVILDFGEFLKKNDVRNQKQLEEVKSYDAEAEILE